MRMDTPNTNKARDRSSAILLVSLKRRIRFHPEEDINLMSKTCFSFAYCDINLNTLLFGFSHEADAECYACLLLILGSQI